jgi:riboflavin kinase / FMN adenylyltransferase
MVSAGRQWLIYSDSHYPLSPTHYPPLTTHCSPVTFLRDLDHLPEAFRGGAVSIGNFDGVHLGHARIVERLLAAARRLGGPAVVFTFDPPPSRILRPEAAPMPLCEADRKAELLTQLGVDAVLAYPTNEAFLRLGAREFFDQIVLDRLAARAMVEGPNFLFGRQRGGNVQVLGQFCAEAGITLEVVDPIEIGGQLVSSSRIRELIAAGRVDEARNLLGHPYRVRGTVVRGAGRGSKLGYPTANIGQIATLLPAPGIYAAQALAAGARWPTAVSLGPNPTFDEGLLKVEAYLIGYEGFLYDQPIEVDFLARLRDIERFGSVEALVAQMARDVAAVKKELEVR